MLLCSQSLVGGNNTSYSFLLTIYLKQIDWLLENHQFSQARQSLLMLESIFSTTQIVKEKTKELIIKRLSRDISKKINLTMEE